MKRKKLKRRYATKKEIEKALGLGYIQVLPMGFEIIRTEKKYGQLRRRILAR